mgnify:CR=1 FL=1
MVRGRPRSERPSATEKAAHHQPALFQVALVVVLRAVEGAGGVSPTEVPESFRRDEARYAVGWYQSITADIWG